MSSVVPVAPSKRRDYEPTEAWDEAFTPAGEPRAHYAALVGALQAIDLADLCSSVTRALDEAGVVFGHGEQSSPFRVDPVPRVLPSMEWNLLTSGLAQRARALHAFIADAYGDRTIVAAGRMPVRAIESAECFEPWMMGVPPPTGAGFVIGFDVVRDSDGTLGVLEDNCRTPSGIAYMTGARDALDRQLPFSPPANRLDPDATFAMLAEALRASAPDGRGDPSIALLSDGPSNSAWFEHRTIADRLGVPIVSPDDLLVRRGRLHARLEDGTRELQVVYRRTDEDRLRYPDGRAAWLADLLLEPCRKGNLGVVNPLGAGLSDDKLVHAYVDEMVRFYLGEEPLVPSVCTYDFGEPEVLQSVMPRLDELVVKPRAGHGGAGVVVCPHASEEDRREITRRVEERPDAWVAQELVMLSTHPTVCDGRLEPRHVDLRPFVVAAGGSAETVPGGLTRVAFGPRALVVNSSQNGGGKDTWALA